jgi:pimeloyl-ACP methyl ester carboxylesterase
MAGSRVGYLHQLLAGAGWTSVFMLPLVRQPTLIVAGSDDPIVPLANAKIMNRLLPNAALHVHDGGHVEIIPDAAEQAQAIEEFRHRA